MMFLFLQSLPPEGVTDTLLDKGIMGVFLIVCFIAMGVQYRDSRIDKRNNESKDLKWIEVLNDTSKVIDSIHTGNQKLPDEVKQKLQDNFDKIQEHLQEIKGEVKSKHP